MATKKVISAVKKSVIDSWLTSLIGIAGSAATILAPMMQNGQSLKTNDWITAAVMLAAGLASKQGNVSGTDTAK